MLKSNSIDRARLWINSCDRHHDCLAPHPGDRKLPSRLLYLGTKDSEIRLIETRDHGDVGRYACLSHCWGKPELMESFKTIRENYSNRLQSIPRSQIPRTFGDAITVSRALGIGYLWIDVMCIIQDDLADWNTEAANMHLIYENSYITIGATASPGPDGGLYLQHSGIFEEIGTASSSDYYRVLGRGSPGHPYDRVRGNPVVDRTKYYQRPLMHRAWGLQERLLSPRYLHFNRHEMIWECKEEVGCECGSRSVLKIAMKQSFHAGFYCLEDIDETWRQLVTAYSMLNLTKESDKLPALSGLAAKVAAVRKPDSHYLAGLWSDSIYHDLLWQVPGSTMYPPVAGRTAKWRAPTWSWASLDSRVTFPHQGALTRFCHIDHEALVTNGTSTATWDEWGQVTKWSLTIRGLLFPAKMEVERFGEVNMILEGQTVVLCTEYNRGPDQMALHVDTQEDASFLKDNTVFCLRLANIRHSEEFETDHTLVLRLDHGSNKYKRIGIVSISRHLNTDENPFAQGGEERTIEII